MLARLFCLVCELWGCLLGLWMTFFQYGKMRRPCKLGYALSLLSRLGMFNFHFQLPYNNKSMELAFVFTFCI